VKKKHTNGNENHRKMISLLFDHSAGTHANEQTVGCGVVVYQTRLVAILPFLLGNEMSFVPDK
jgi:hypothetical protein